MAPGRVATAFIAAVLSIIYQTVSDAADYEVGEGVGMLSTISQVPWESLLPGDRVLIHWRADPYKEKWVLCRRGTEQDPITVSGVPGPEGQLPVIDLRTNWLMTDWVTSHSSGTASVVDHGDNIEGADPGFEDFDSGDFAPRDGGACQDGAGPLGVEVVPEHAAANHYVRHQMASIRRHDDAPDLGAVESGVIFGDDFEDGSSRWWSSIEN